MSVPYSDDDDDGFGMGWYSGSSSPQTTTSYAPSHEWDRLLNYAIYARWSKEDDEAYECLAEIYNQHIATTAEERLKITYKPRLPTGYS